MESRSTIQARLSRLSIYLVVVTVLGASIGGSFGSIGMEKSAGVASRSANGNSASNPYTGYPTGSPQDHQILAFLEQSGYEGGGTVVHIIDPTTGYPIGSSDDQRILALLEKSQYEGGGTVVRAASHDRALLGTCSR